MREEIARIAADLRRALEAEADLPLAEHVLVPRAKPRPPPAHRTMERIAAEVRSCVRCSLCRGRTHAVPGEGPPDARLMVIGEAPGGDEDRQGRPFVGRAGALLTKMLAAINVRRDEVFIGNVLKCRPPKNRDPKPDEVAQCRRYLMAQIAALRPSVILTLGRFSAQLLLGTTRGILSIRGTPRPFPYEGGVATLLPSLHPAYLLRNDAAKREAWEDMKHLHRMLRERTGDWPPPI
ncbi:MAG: uracil-DNA glycosylase [Planctomycetota bacterium]